MTRTPAIISTLFIAASLHAQTADTFRSPTAGFEITKPPSWFFATAEQNAANLRATQLNDQELKAAMLKYATTPLVVITKYEEPYPDLNPSLKVNIRPLGDFKGRSPVELIGLILPQLQRAFKNLIIAEQPTEVVVAGFQAGYVRIHYTLQTSTGQAFPTASQLWFVPRGDFFFLIGAGTRQDQKNGSRAEIADIIDSIRLN